MKKLLWLFTSLVCAMELSSQKIQTPDQVYGELFTDVQMSGVFPDSKTFVDCIPKKDPAFIVKEYLAAKNDFLLPFNLKLFLEQNFILPHTPQLNYSHQEKDVVAHIKNLWAVLKRDADTAVEGSSLVALPYPYIVPGGRFREIYYWDSYFTMLGLKENGEYGIMQDMIDNFSWMIMNYGHIPNGNRTYYMSRSQPPFFSLMVELLASVKGDSIYTHYLPALEKEYHYWWDYKADRGEYNRGKKFMASNHTWIFRYFDGTMAPRQEAYKEDSLLLKSIQDLDLKKFEKNHDLWFALHQNTKAEELYRNLRSAAESGWDFSSRWFFDGKDMRAIRTIDITPIDLNCLIYKLQTVLSKAYGLKGDTAKQSFYAKGAQQLVEKGIQYYFYDNVNGWFVDYDAGWDKIRKEHTIAGMFPLFMKIATKEQAARAVDFLKKNFLKPGGVVTTLQTTGQQWDAPNGWPPMQWVTITGLENYGYHDLAKDIAKRWIKLNNDVYQRTGKLMEKYNVIDPKAEAGGGEYPGQDGYGWTNGVLMALIAKYGL